MGLNGPDVYRICTIHLLHLLSEKPKNAFNGEYHSGATSDLMQWFMKVDRETVLGGSWSLWLKKEKSYHVLSIVRGDRYTTYRQSVAFDIVSACWIWVAAYFTGNGKLWVPSGLRTTDLMDLDEMCYFCGMVICGV